MIRRARLEGILSAVVPRCVVAAGAQANYHPAYLSAPTRAVQRFYRASAVHALAAAEDYARRTRSPFGWSSWPQEFDVGREAARDRYITPRGGGLEG